MCDYKNFLTVIDETKRQILYPTTKVCISMLPFNNGLEDFKFGFKLNEGQYKTLITYRSLMFAFRQYMLCYISGSSEKVKTLNIEIKDLTNVVDINELENGCISFDGITYSFPFDETAISLFVRDLFFANIDLDEKGNPIYVEEDKILFDEVSDYISFKCSSKKNNSTCLIEYNGNVVNIYDSLSVLLGDDYLSKVPVYSENESYRRNTSKDFDMYFNEIILPRKRYNVNSRCVSPFGKKGMNRSLNLV